LSLGFSNVTKFQHKLRYVVESLPINFIKSKLRSGNPFWKVNATNKCGVGKMSKFGPKLVATMPR